MAAIHLSLPFPALHALTTAVQALAAVTTCTDSHSARIPPTITKYKNHRFPVEIISHAVGLYFRFYLNFRDVEELLGGILKPLIGLNNLCCKSHE